MTAGLRQEIAKFSQYLEQGQKSDSYVFKKFRDHEQFIVKLGSTEADMIRFLPGAAGQHVRSKEVEALKTSLNKVEQLKEKRATMKLQLTLLSQGVSVGVFFVHKPPSPPPYR